MSASCRVLPFRCAHWEGRGPLKSGHADATINVSALTLAYAVAGRGPCARERLAGASVASPRNSFAPLGLKVKLLIFHRFVLGPFLHFAPNLVLRNRLLAEDGPIVQPEPEAPAEDRPDRPEI